MHLFYQPDFEQKAILENEEAHHALRVLRLAVGDLVQVTNGVGELFDVRVSKMDKKGANFEILKKYKFERRNYAVEIALAPTKNMDRVEWFVEKAVEVGIDTISFFYAAHSERKNLKLERLQKVAVSAMKQSLQTYLPDIREFATFNQFVENCQAAQKYIAHLPDSANPPAHLLKIAPPNDKYCVLIGPEGDFAPHEIDLALRQGFEMVTLGHTRLRTETAAWAACHALNLANA